VFKLIPTFNSQNPKFFFPRVNGAERRSGRKPGARVLILHFNGSPLLCPVNAISSSSYLFRLQYPRVLHCRIVPIQKLKTFVALERKKTPITLVLSKSKRSNLKTLKLLVGYMTGG
jgi:hypothetical protein